MENVTFYAKETTGSIGDKKPESSRGETTGSIGYRAFADDTVPNIDRTLERDSVCFRGYDEPKKEHSAAVTFFGITSGVALAILGLGYLHKANAAGKITHEGFKKFVSKLDCVTEPCHKLCSKVKTFGKDLYKKISDKFNKKS